VSWDAVAALAELAGAIGVIASLVYLALQIRHNTAAVRAENLRETVNGLIDCLNRLTADPRDQAIYTRGLASIASLSPEEVERFWTLAGTVFANCELIHDLYRDRLIKVTTFDASIRNLLGMLSNPGMREIWEQRKFGIADDFRTFVDSLLATGAPSVS
jgi:hypothetical protein